MIEQPLTPGLPLAPNPLAQAITVAMEDQQQGAEGAPVEIEVDDGVIIDFAPGQGQGQDVPFNANLAEYMEETDLIAMGVDLVTAFESDRLSREEWEKTYIKGLDLLGLHFEERTKPWKGAAGVFHPMLTEAVIRFQASTIQEIFPASGPAKANVPGNLSTERVKQSGRVVTYLNYTATKVMKEYRRETEKMLFSLPIAGSAFRKVYYNEMLKRPASMFVPAEDFVVSYGASDLSTCERATHVMKKTPNELLKMQVSGFYRDVEVPEATPDLTDIQRKYDKLKGDSENYDFDKRHTFLEMQVDYDVAGFEDPDGIALPYVITVDKSSNTVLAVRRNWIESDPNKLKRDHFVHYEYIPGIGFYGFGLINIIGGLSKSATSILRQLIDSGTLANLPGGLKTRGLRIKGDNDPIMPGEFRDVDVPMGAVKDNIAFLPRQEPSTVLYQLLGDLVQEGKRIASAADMKAADMNAEAPVGTTLAILEKEMKVLSAVLARVHASMGQELIILSDIIKQHGPEKYPYEIEGEFIPKEDFSEKVDVIPVSDPNAGTMAQRIMQFQAALQLAATKPEIYDEALLHRQMLEVLGIRDADKIVPTEEDQKPTDPITENAAILNGKPVKAFLYQDHEAHIQVHMAMAKNPEIIELMKQNPKAQAIMAAGASHITEHIAFAYRAKIEKELGTKLPHPDEQLPDDIELRLSQLVAPAAAQVTGKAQKMQQAEENAEKSKDPVIQLQERELALEEKKQHDKNREVMAKIDADIDARREKMGLERRKLDDNRDLKTGELVVKLVDSQTKAGAQQGSNETKEKIEGFKLGIGMVDRALDRITGRNKGNE
jgi:hypothetical protein